MAFEDFYSHYPLKKGKGAARKKYETLKKKKVLPDDETLIKAIYNQHKERKYLRSQNKFVPEWKHPSTWLNQECWDDECFFIEAKPQKPAKIVSSYQNLQRAKNILHNLGIDKFESFCKQVNMSQQDHDAVLFPFQSKLKPEKLAARMF